MSAYATARGICEDKAIEKRFTFIKSGSHTESMQQEIPRVQANVVSKNNSYKVINY